jgi:hypothetical protein
MNLTPWANSIKAEVNMSVNPEHFVLYYAKIRA